MKNTEMIVMLRPKTGMDYGKMYCEMMDDYFVLTHKKWALLDANAGKFYKVYYKDIKQIEDKNYMFVKGIRLFFNNAEINFPSSPSLVLGGLFGSIIDAFKSKKYILYFDKASDKDTFIEKCKNSNKSLI